MPGPAAIAAGVGLVLAVADIAFSIFDVAKEDPTQDKLDDLARGIEDLQSSLDDLGADIMRELEVIEDLIPTVAINQAVADAQSARGELLRLLRTETPSEAQILSTINSAENALLRVLGQAGPKLDSDNPESAIGFAAALSFAAGIRLEVAYHLEDGAVGAETLREALGQTASYIERISEAMEEQLSEIITVATTYDVRALAGGGYMVDYATVATSPVTGETAGSYKQEYYSNIIEYLNGFNSEIAYRRAYTEDRIHQRRVELDMEELRLGELPDAAAFYAGLTDGTDEVGTARSDSLTGTEGNDLLTGLGGNDRLAGMDDGDVLYGGSGRDVMLGGAGHDVLDGGQGNDRMKGQGDNDLLRGTGGNDRVKGNAGDDDVRGGTGRDIVAGGAGDDTLNGGQGADVLKGGSGADVFVFSADPASGVDSVRGFSSGVDGLELNAEFYDRLPLGTLDLSRLDYGSPSDNRATLIYDEGTLSYDPDGRGSARPVEIAQFRGAPDLEASDIFLL